MDEVSGESVFMKCASLHPEAALKMVTKKGGVQPEVRSDSKEADEEAMER